MFRLFTILTLFCAVLGACTPSRMACEQAYGPCGVVLDDTTLQVNERRVELPGDTLGLRPVDLDALGRGDTLSFNSGRFWADLFIEAPAATDSAVRSADTNNTHTPLVEPRTETPTDLRPRLRIRGGCDTVEITVRDTLWRARRTKVVAKPCPDCIPAWKLALGSIGIAAVVGLFGFGIGRIT